jgi:anti-sigma regulatory factor (Ser/Thr protein kinase)
LGLAFRIEVSADTRYLEMIASLVEDFCQAAGLEEDVARGMQVAVIEICTNTVLHGYKCDAEKYFVLEGRQDDCSISFDITEWGTPFNLNDIPTPKIDAPLDNRPSGGWGLYMVKKLTDDFQYNIDDSGCKTFHLKKKLTPCQTGPA